MKGKEKNRFRQIVAVMVVIVILLYIYVTRDQLLLITNFNFQSVAWLMIATFVFFLVQGQILKVSLEPFGVSLKFVEWFGIIILTLCANYALPFSGIGFRVAYLKKKHNLSYSHFIGSVGVICAAEVLVFCAFGVAGLFYINNAMENRYFWLTGVLALGALGMFLLLTAGPLFFSLKFPGRERFNLLFDGFEQATKARRVVFKLILFTVIEFLACTTSFYFAYQAFSLEVPYIATFVASALSDLSFFFRFAPGGLGTYEASVVYASILFNLTLSQGFSVAFLTRVISITWFLTLGPIAFLTLVKPSGIGSTQVDGK